MSAREPAVAVKFVVIEAQLAYELRMFRTPALDAFAHIENHQPIAPVSEIRQTVDHLQIVQVTTNHFRVSRTGCNRGRYFIGNFPTRHFLRIPDVGEINNAHRAGGVIRQVDVVTIDKRTMNSARDRRRVFRNWFWMSRIGSVEKGDAILAVGSAFARDDQNPSVRGGADVID